MPPSSSGMQVPLLLVIGAVVGDDLGVAGIGCLAAEDDRRPGRPAQDLVEERELELPVALAAELGPQVGGPQALGPHLVLEWIDDRAQGLVRRRELEARATACRSAPPPSHERFRPVQLGLELGVGLEIPGHLDLPSSSVAE